MIYSSTNKQNNTLGIPEINMEFITLITRERFIKLVSLFYSLKDLTVTRLLTIYVLPLKKKTSINIVFSRTNIKMCTALKIRIT